MKPLTVFIVIAFTALLVGCAGSIPPPRELIDARQAYAHASASPSTQLVPADMDNAREALARAEQSFQDDPQSHRTLHLSNLAYRDAKMAEVLGTSAAEIAAAGKTNKDSQPTTTENLKQR